jgi:hypothetical protein
MSEQTSEQVAIFFDALGRTIVGEVIGETPENIEIKNPSVLHAGLNPEGKIQVNLIPAFFREFLKDWNSPLVFSYRKDSIVRDAGGITLDEKLLGQYKSMWAPRPPRDEVRKIVRELKPADTEVKPVERLNLFDEVKPETATTPASA